MEINAVLQSIKPTNIKKHNQTRPKKKKKLKKWKQKQPAKQIQSEIQEIRKSTQMLN